MSQLCFFAFIVAAGLAADVPVRPAVLVAQGQPAMTQPPKGYKSFTDPNLRFSLVYPDRWKPVAGARDQLLTIASGDLKIVVVIEQQPIISALTEISQRFMGMEADSLKSLQPGATDVVPSVSTNRPTTLVIDYSRTGINGAERLKQYSIYEGTIVLRVTCIAPTKDFDKTAAQFETLVNSVKILARPAGGSPIEQR